MEIGLHGLVVGNAYRIVAFDNAVYFFWRCNGLFLNNFKIIDNVKNDVWRNDGETRNFLIGKEFVFDLDDSFAT